MKLFTIGFTKTTAELFFSKLRDASVKRIIDTRVNRDGQLSGFAKVPDLPYFLRNLAGIGYEAQPALAPTVEMLKAYREKKMTWATYESSYLELLRGRHPERLLDIAGLDRSCLLCSEHEPEHCHRRLAAEYLQFALQSEEHVEIIHL